MDLNWFESIIYGLISGFAEFLPISSHGHQQLMLHLFGAQQRDPVRDLLVHLTMLFVLYTSCRSLIDNVQQVRHQRHSRRASAAIAGLPDYRFIKNATIPMLVGILILSYIIKANNNLLLTSVFLLINGILLFVSGRVMQGNKDARSMSLLDSALVGVISGFSAISGISRIGCVTTTAIARGAGRQHAFNWALLLSIPALILLAGMDVLNIFTVATDIPFWKSFFTYILSILGTYVGSYYSIIFMKFLAVRTGYSIFSYYCWGASLFSFLIYLTVA